MPSLLLLIFGCQVSGRGTLDGPAVGVAQHEDELCLQGPSAKLKAAQDTAFCMCTGVPSIAQHEEISRQCIKNGLQGHTRICASNDGGVWRLALGRQSLSHVRMHLGNGSTHHEALIAILQVLQCELGLLSCSNSAYGLRSEMNAEIKIIQNGSSNHR